MLSLSNAFDLEDLKNFEKRIFNYLNKKIQIVRLYKSEIHAHPHPRSLESIRSSAILRGSQCGCKFAVGFILVYSRNGI